MIILWLQLPNMAIFVILVLVMSRRIYPCSLYINETKIIEVVIDPHFEDKHSESINDEIILKLVGLLDGGEFEANDFDPPYEYFVSDGLIIDGKKYKLIWLLEQDRLYVGIINA